MMQISLCGMPGSGKSTFGRLLGERSGLSFYDLDELIESRGTSIAELFQESEEAFRKVESETLQRFINAHQNEPFILALGGGTLEDPDSLQLLLDIGTLCYLDIPIERIAEQLNRETAIEKRPLIADQDGEKRLEWLRNTLNKRRPKFLQSRIITGLEAFSDLDLFTKRVELFTKKS